MTFMTPEKPFTFHDTWNYYLAAWKGAPLEPITDHRFAAGLLFERNDGIICRRLTVWISLIIEIELPYNIVRIPVNGEIKQILVAEHLLEEAASLTLSWKLSMRGRQKVVEEWFSDGTVEDFFYAGRALDFQTGEAGWRE